MSNINKIQLFDKCVGGSYPNFKELINPMYDQFNRFYTVYKDIFAEESDIVEAIIFNINDDNVASFDVICRANSSKIIRSKDRKTLIEKTENGYHFDVQPNNDYYCM